MMSDSYQLLHVTLTGFGDTTRTVRILSDSPLMTATVGINLAAAAAREARAALLVDGDTHARLVAGLLDMGNSTGIAEALSIPASLSSHVVRVAVGRDQYLKALLAGQGRMRKGNDRAPHVPREFEQQFQLLAKNYDLTVLLASSDAEKTAAWLPAADVILCARIGVTRVNWLARSVLHLRASGIRLRAVLLWAADAPKAR
jgi:Mrp family chromosome partitioning ATPase